MNFENAQANGPAVNGLAQLGVSRAIQNEQAGGLNSLSK